MNVWMNNYLGGHPVRCADKGSPFAQRGCDLCRNAEIGQFDVSVVRQQNIRSLFSSQIEIELNLIQSTGGNEWIPMKLTIFQEKQIEIESNSVKSTWIRRKKIQIESKLTIANQNSIEFHQIHWNRWYGMGNQTKNGLKLD